MAALDLALLAVVVLTMVLAVGSAGLGGGWEAVRRQAGRFVVLGLLLVAVVLTTRFVSTQFGEGGMEALGLVLLIATAPILYLLMRPLRREEERTRLAEQTRRPAFWLLFGGFVIAALAIPLVIIMAVDR